MKNHEIVLKMLRSAGFEAFLVGGCVRDMCLGVTPKDFDIATNALPEQVEEVFRDFKTLEIGQAFGIVVVIVNSEQIEIATFRKESNHNGRKPEKVEFTSLEEDSKRRDFTFNAMFLDPLDNSFIDLHEGQKDLAKRVVKFVGNPKERLEEDKLRALRAIRFACALEFNLDPETLKAIKDCDISNLSAERVRDELLKILSSNDPARGITLLKISRLLHQVLPELARTIGEEQDCFWHPEGDVFTHSRMVLEMMSSFTKDPILRLTALLHDIGKCDCKQEKIVDGIVRISNVGHDQKGAELARELLKRLKFDNSVIDRVSKLIDLHMKAHFLDQMRKAKLIGFMREHKAIMNDLILLQHCDTMSSGSKASLMEFLTKSFAEMEEKIEQKPLVNGDDLIKLGFKPSPRFKEILEYTQNRQDEGMQNKEVLLKEVLAFFPMTSRG